MESNEATRNCCQCGHVGYIRKIEKDKPGPTLIMECPICQHRWQTILPRKKAVG